MKINYKLVIFHCHVSLLESISFLGAIHTLETDRNVIIMLYIYIYMYIYIYNGFMLCFDADMFLNIRLNIVHVSIQPNEPSSKPSAVPFFNQ